MNHRSIGSASCSVLGLGTGMLASLSRNLSDAERRLVVDTAAECGINLIDTADSYAQGECEEFLGRALRGRRERFLLSTKAGFRFASLGGFARLLKPLARKVLGTLRNARSIASRARQGAMAGGGVRSQDFAPASIERCLHASLRRLRTDALDCFFLHNPTAEALRDEALLAMLQNAVREGKTRHFGVSSPEPEILRAALDLPGLSVLQMPVHPCVDEGIAQIQQACAQRGIGVIGNQFAFSGKLLAPHAGEPDAEADARARLLRIAEAKGVQMRQLLLSYALAQPGLSAVLTGTTDPVHLRQNVADALAPVALSVEDLAAIRAAARP